MMGPWQGLAQGLKDTAATGMNLLQLQQTRQHQTAMEINASRQLKIAEDQAALKNRALKVEADMAEKGAKLIPFKETLTKLGYKSPEEHEWWEKKAGLELEDVGGTSYIQTMKGIKLYADTSKNPQDNYELGHIKMSNFDKQMAAIKDQLTNPETSGKLKPEQAQQLQAQYDALVQQRTGAANATKRAEQQLAAANKDKSINVQLPDGTWVAQDPVTGSTVPLAGTPEGVVKSAQTAPAHGVTEITSPDGKTAQKMQYNRQTNRYDIPVGDPYAVKSQVINLNTGAQSTEAFNTWTPEEKEQAFGYNMITGKPPENARGMRANDRQAYAKGYAKWQLEKGYKPSDIALMQADYRAGNMSLGNMAKQEAPMAAFVGNINRQIDKVQQLYNNNDRVGLRLIDLPVREIKMRAKGSGDEAVKASYLLEISNEIGKLSSGASASVQQLSDSAKEDWKKVHDPNLSLKEIMKVVNATRDQANMRIQTWREAKEGVRTQLRSLGVPDTAAATHQYIPGKGIVEIK